MCGYTIPKLEGTYPRSKMKMEEVQEHKQLSRFCTQQDEIDSRLDRLKLQSGLASSLETIVDLLEGMNLDLEQMEKVKIYDTRVEDLERQISSLSQQNSDLRLLVSDLENAHLHEKEQWAIKESKLKSCIEKLELGKNQTEKRGLVATMYYWFRPPSS